jgi:hypothetical protein
MFTPEAKIAQLPDRRQRKHGCAAAAAAREREKAAAGYW